MITTPYSVTDSSGGMSMRDDNSPDHSISEERFKKVFDSNPVALGIIDANSRFYDVNPSFCQLMDLPKEHILGKTSTEVGLFNIDTLPRGISAGGKHDTGIRNKEISFITQSGIVRVIQYSVDVITSQNSRQLLITAMNITDRSLAEQAIRERENLYAALFTASPMPMAMSRLSDGRVVHVNRLFLETMGINSPEDVIGRTAQEAGLLAVPDERQRAIAHLREHGKLSGFEMQLKKKDGTLLPVLASSELLEIAGEKCVLTSAIDISARKQAETKLVRSEFLMRTALENLPIIFYMIDTNGEFKLSIGAGLKGLGLEQNQVVGLSVYDTYRDYPIIISSINRALAGQQVTFETNVSGAVHYNVCVPSSGWFDGVVAVALDITEHKQTEEALQKVQKLESLGILAGGIAHDFNNLLGGIFGYVDLARSGTAEPETRKYLTAILKSMDRVRGLTHQLLTFSKGGSPDRKVISISDFLRETVQFAMSGSPVACTYDISDQLWPCDIDKNQIGQVIDNIVINAKQAMPAGGTLVVTTANVSLSQAEHPLLENGDYVRISLQDSGIGIPEDIISRIFDPFFTTKSQGHGLGLATSHSIVKRHGGTIDVEPAPGKGTTFHVYLPAVARPNPETVQEKSLKTGSGTILIVDDDDLVRQMIGHMLTSLGYDIILKRNCEQAISHLKNSDNGSQQCSAMIFDLTISGGMGGMEAAREVRKFNSQIPIYAISGYADDPIMGSPAAYGFNGSISKPFTIAELSEMLRTK
jgi:PAS domain S-box-containing protein